MKRKQASGGSQFVGRDGLTHYQRNKQVYLDKNKRRRQENAAYVRSIKEKGSCLDCGIKDWRVLDFDHLPQYEKVADIASPLARSWGRDKLNKEIAKCELVCSNCHRIRTYDRASII